MRNWLRYTALALAAAVLVTVAAGCDIYLERRGAVTTPACELRNGYPSVAAVDGGALLCEWDYRTGESYLSRLDVRRDQVTLARTLSGEWSLVEQMFADGQVVLQRWEEAGSSFRFLNAKLEDVRDFVPEAEGGRLSHDGAGYYYLKDAALYRQDTVTGDVQRMALDQELRFVSLEGIHPAADLLLLWCRMSPFSQKLGMALVELHSGTCLMVQERADMLWFMERGLCEMSYDEDGGRDTIRYDTADGGCRQASAAVFGSEADSVWVVSGSQYALSSDRQGETLFRLGQTLERCEVTSVLAEAGVTGHLSTVCWLPTVQKLLGMLYDPAQDALRLVVLDPARMTFTLCGETTEAPSFLTVDEGITGAYWGELAGQPLPEDMGALRAYADRLEEKYDVDILLSDQCAGPCAASWEDITTTDQAGLEDEVAAIYPALEALDRTLALYPDGFFAQFRNARGEGGVQFLPVSAFHMSFEVIGMSFENGDWHCIAYQVSNERLEALLCHEIWHAMEDKLISEKWNAIDSWTWSACNPRGFDYYYDYDDAMNEADGSWLYFGTAEDVYFVDAYSTMNPREDRARIMEYIMGAEDEADALAQCPVIRRKLEIMAAAVRAGFDTAGWGVARWEQPLTVQDRAA